MTVQCESAGTIYSSVAPAVPRELFPSSVESVFDRLECIAQDDNLYEEGEVRPTTETIQWAKRVLLRVIPRYYLRTAEIDVFQGEIHVTWERGDRRVVAFLPSPGLLKLYLEYPKENGEMEHLLRSTSVPWAINSFLKWLYS